MRKASYLLDYTQTRLPNQAFTQRHSPSSSKKSGSSRPCCAEPRNPESRQLGCNPARHPGKGCCKKQPSPAPRPRASTGVWWERRLARYDQGRDLLGAAAQSQGKKGGEGDLSTPPSPPAPGLCSPDSPVRGSPRSRCQSLGEPNSSSGGLDI